MLMFWGMLEIGVAMVAVCLPTLMPLFHGWTVEKFFQTLRTFFSLESLSLRRSARSSSSKRHQKMDSETSLAKEDFGYTKQSNSHQAYAMGPVDSQHTDAEKVPGGSVWVNSKLTQTVETV